MNNENNFKRLTPFKMQVLQSFPFIDEDFDAITNYELLCKVVEYLNTTVDNVNLLESDFQTLYNYVHDYFDNLDVQEEINKKLDEMAEDGTLTNIIKNYVDPLFNSFTEESQANYNSFTQNINGEVDSQNNRINIMENKINSVTSGSPAGVYNTVNDLTTANPDHTKIYVVLADNNWYYYNTSTNTWTSGGTYLSSNSDLFLKEDSINSVANKVVYNITNNLKYTGLSQGIDYDNSINKLKYKKLIPFYIQAGIYSNGIVFNANAERGISNLLDIEGTLHIYNIGQINYDFLEINPITQTINRRLDNTFSNNYYKTIECSSNYKYAIFIKNADNTNPISQDTIDKANKTMLLCIESVSKNELLDISQSNLFSNPINGGYIGYNDGILANSDSMCYSDYTLINNREKLYLTPVYCQLAFYDMNKQYISGFYYNPITSSINNINNIVDIPNNAIYLRSSTRLGNKKDLIISENTFTSLDKNYYINDKITPKELVKNTKLKYYCNLDLSTHPNDDRIIKSNSGVSPVSDGYSISNGYLKYIKYICPDNSISTFRFRCNEDSDFSVGLDCRQFNQMTDAGLRVRIKTATKELIVYSTDWYNTNIEKAHVNFDFNVANNDIYCIRINKISIYDITIELFNAKTPNEVCSVHLYTDKNDTVVNTNNMARAWGSPMVLVGEGIVVFTSISQLVSNNQYPKVAIFGDSYVENFSRPYNNSYARLMKDILEDELFISGAGGDNSSNILARIKNELLYTKPEYCIINTGVNDRYITQQQYISNMNNIISILESLDITPILTTCPRVLDTDNIETLTYINNFVRNSGYEYIDIAYALSTGDGVTQDTNKMNSDRIHPNNLGANAIIQYIKAYLPYLLIK